MYREGIFSFRVCVMNDIPHCVLGAQRTDGEKKKENMKLSIFNHSILKVRTI